MNAARRKALDTAIGLLQEAEAKLDEAKSIIETAKDEEREYYDNMPESLQSGDKGSAAETAADALDEVHNTLDELDISDLVGKIEEARDA